MRYIAADHCIATGRLYIAELYLNRNSYSYSYAVTVLPSLGKVNKYWELGLRPTWMNTVLYISTPVWFIYLFYHIYLALLVSGRKDLL